MSIEIDSISKRFGEFLAVDNVDLVVPDGKLTALLGPSGSGKTTLLRIIAGLEFPDAGRIRFHGDDATDLHVSERGVGFVFQHYALFRHMTVFHNVAYGLSVRPRSTRPAKSEIRKRVTELLRLIQLEWIADRYPSQLSGGQRQRVALARALAVEPRVLLLDEPFGALDAQVRAELRRWLKRLHNNMHITTVFVTHDQEEALELSDRVVVMNRGRIEQEGSPEDIYERPATPFVCEFIGQANLFPAYVKAGAARIGRTLVPTAEDLPRDDGKCVAYVRPHDIELIPRSARQGAIEATVETLSIVGPVARLSLRRSPLEAAIQAEVPKEAVQSLCLAPGATAWFRPTRGRLFAVRDS